MRIFTSTVIDSEIRFNDSLILRVEFPEIVSESIDAASGNIFPGREQLLEDVLRILEDEYHFDVIEDVYEENIGLSSNRGKKMPDRRKGHISNRKDSMSVYYDTYYDLSNAVEPLKRQGITNLEIPNNTTVECYIHLRFSDHDLKNTGYLDHRNYLKDNMKKYTAGKDLLVSIDEEVVSIPAELLYRMYDRALDEVRYQLDDRIQSWVRTARRRAQERADSQN